MSCSNKNSQSEYILQTEENKYIIQNHLLKDSRVPKTSFFPGNGLLPTHMARETLGINSVDIETYLYNINATNLVKPRPQFSPQLKELKSLNMIQKSPLIMPEPNIFTNIYNERPLIYK